MRKETIIAIILGVVFGVTIALLILAKNKELQLTKSKTLSQDNIINKKTKSPLAEYIPLKIHEPQDKAVFREFTAQIKGEADKNSLIVIQSPGKDLVFKNEKSQFDILFPLNLGENVITITVYPENKLLRIQEKELKVYNLPDEL